MASSNDTASLGKLAIQIILAVGSTPQPIVHPVADEAAAIALMKDIKKTPGFYFLGEETGAPVMFHVRHIVMVSIVLLPEDTRTPAPKLARLSQ